MLQGGADAVGYRIYDVCRGQQGAIGKVMTDEALLVLYLEESVHAHLQVVVLRLDQHRFERLVVVQRRLLGSYQGGESFVHQYDDGECCSFLQIQYQRFLLLFLWVGFLLEQVRYKVPSTLNGVAALLGLRYSFLELVYASA